MVEMTSAPDLGEVKANVSRMIDDGAGRADVHRYLSEIGVSAEQLRAHGSATPPQTAPQSQPGFPASTPAPPPPASQGVARDGGQTFQAPGAPPGFNLDTPPVQASGFPNSEAGMLDTVTGAVSDAWTGEGRTEFPDLPEITEAEIGFFESAIPNLKLGLTLDPAEKAQIIATHFADDPRLGGVYEDSFGNPIVEWNGQPYYVNKPGASMQDATDLVAQTAQFVGPSKLAGMARSAGGRLLAGAGTYGATDVAQQAGTMAVGGKEAYDPMQTALTGGVGGVAEAALPPLLRTGARMAKPAWERLARQFGFNPPGAPVTGGKIPLTEGQRSGDMRILQREEQLRQGAYGDAAQGTMRQFDDTQLGAIRKEADTLQGDIGAGSGFEGSALPTTGARLQGDLVEEAARRKGDVRGAYDAAAMASAERPAMLSREGVMEITGELLTVPREMSIVREQIELMPRLQSALKRVKQLNKLSQNPNFRPQNWDRVESSRKVLNTLWRDAPKGSTEETALRKLITRLDAWTDEAITRGLMDGDPGTIEAIKSARDLARRHFVDFGKSKGRDPAGTTMVKILDEAQATPEQTINFIMGAGRVTSTAQARGLVQRIKSIFGADSEQVRLLKDAFMVKAFTGVRQGERQVLPGSLTTNATKALHEAKTLVDELFTPAERARIWKLVSEVSQTLTPEDARNPSRSAMALMQMLRDNNLISIAGRGMRYVPLMGEVGGAMREAGGALTAKNLTSQLERLISVPLVTAGATAAALSQLETDSQSQRTAGRRSLAAQLSPPPPTGGRLAADLMSRQPGGAPMPMGPAPAPLPGTGTRRNLAQSLMNAGPR